MVKSLVLPHFLQLASVSTLCYNLLSHLDKFIFDFVWNNNQHLLSKCKLIKPVQLGGMKKITIFYFSKTAQIMFIKRLCNHVDAKWEHLSEYLSITEKKFTEQNGINIAKQGKDSIKKSQVDKYNIT